MQLRNLLTLMSVALIVCGCGGGGSGGGGDGTGGGSGGGAGNTGGPYTIGGAVSGLLPGNSVTVQLNVAASISASANGSFTFATTSLQAASYNVTVLSEPLGQTCAVVNGSGVVGTSNVTNVAVNCSSNSYLLGAKVSGLLANTSLLLQNNGANNLAISTNGSADFPSAVASGAIYNVVVATQPLGQTCTVASPTGTVVNVNIVVSVTCQPNSYSVGGVVTGLAGGSNIVLQDNGKDNISLTTNGSFVFPTLLASTATYAVTILNNPSGETCAVTQGSGTVLASNVAGVSINCQAAQYNIVANVVGQPNVPGLILQNNNSDNLPISKSGVANFNTTIPNGSTYSVSILSQPLDYTCFVLNGSGTVNASKAVVNVICPWHIVYGVDGGSSAYVFYIDQATGAAVAQGTPTLVPSAPISIALGASGKFAYVAAKDGNIYIYSISAQDGTLAPASNSPYYVGCAPFYNTTMSRLYCSVPPNFSVYTIAAATGNISLLSTMAVPLQNCNTIGTVDPSGNYAYGLCGTPDVPPPPGGNIPSGGDQVLSEFQLNSAVGSLTFMNDSNLGGGIDLWDIGDNILISVETSADYSALKCIPCIYTYKEDPTTGSLTLGSGRIGVNGPASLFLSPSSRLLFAHGGIQTMNVYSLDPGTANLSAIASASVPPEFASAPVIVFDPTERFAYSAGSYVPGASATLRTYSFDSANAVVTTLSTLSILGPTGYPIGLASMAVK